MSALYTPKIVPGDSDEMARYKLAESELDGDNRPGVLTRISRAYKALNEPEQAVVGGRLMGMLADLCGKETVTHSDGRTFPNSIRTRAKCIEMYIHLELQLLEAAERHARGGADHTIQVNRQSVSVTVDQAVVEERARVLAEGMAGKGAK